MHYASINMVGVDREGLWIRLPLREYNGKRYLDRRTL